MRGFIIYPTYRIIDGKAHVYLFGRLENGESFLTINQAKPYFYIRKTDLNAAKGIIGVPQFKVDKISGLRNFDGEPIVKIVLDIPKQVPELRKAFEEHKIVCYEADVRFAYRFMMDKGLLGSLEINGEYKKGNRVNRIYEEPDIKPAPSSYVPKLKMLSFDIETDKTAGNLYSVSLFTESFRKVFMITKNHRLKNAEACSDEHDLLTRLQDKILELDPDIITGWNAVDFDLHILKQKYQKHKIPFQWGRAEWDVSLRLYNDFFRSSTADIPGRVMLDGIDMMKSSFIKLVDYKLNTAAKHFLKKRKLIEGPDRHKVIDDYFRKDQQKLADYNLMDSELAYEIIMESGVLDLSIQRSLLTGMPLDRVSASIASLDSLYLRELQKQNIVAPSSTFAEKESPITGGYVMSSKPGIYDYILVLDFKSMYPSIMRTFNIDPASFLGKKLKKNQKADAKNVIKAPNGAYFINQEGILPMLIQKLWEQRDIAKKKNNKLASFAIKTTMASFFGVLASPMCRFFSMDMANAITHFAQYFIKKTTSEVEKLGYEVIYGDTDSIFVNSKASTPDEAQKIGTLLQDHVNKFYKNHIQKEYVRKNFMELEFEKCFTRFILPKTRHSEKGSKKRYAGLIVEKDGSERIDFTGLEFVRRDWTQVSKTFQLAILDKVFHKQEVAEYIKKFIQDLRKGKYDDQLVYRKALRKDVEEYTKTTPPHVKAAMLLDKIDSNIIEYYMTADGPQPVQNLKSRIDYEHYIDKQLKPIADSILVFFRQNFDDVIAGAEQKTLFGY
ncbi:DNA polymerase II [Candidatus Woesearchaeota archaeon]|nr:DNA polymerase II [Candidatus Woesearchaeota archaeon]